MRLHGRVYKDGKFWLAEIPILDAMTQGRTRKEAFAMVADLLETLANRPGFSVHVHPGNTRHLRSVQRTVGASLACYSGGNGNAAGCL